MNNPNGYILKPMNTPTETTQSTFADLVTAAAEGQCSSLLEVAGLAGIPYTVLVRNLDAPNLFTLHQLALLGLVLGISVPTLVAAAL